MLGNTIQHERFSKPKGHIVRKKVKAERKLEPEAAPMSTEEQKATILSVLVDFCEDSVDDMFAYMEHVGFDAASLKSANDLPPAWCAFYRIRGGVYDVERAFQDLATWPPIAARIAYLRAHPEELGK